MFLVYQTLAVDLNYQVHNLTRLIAILLYHEGQLCLVSLLHGLGTDQKIRGTIAHFSLTFSSSNFLVYHSLLIRAAMVRFATMKARALNKVLFIKRPGGAAINASERYIRHSAE